MPYIKSFELVLHIATIHSRIADLDAEAPGMTTDSFKLCLYNCSLR